MNRRFIQIALALLIVLANIKATTVMGDAAVSSVSTVPSAASVSPGSQFDVAIRINTNTMVLGTQFVLNWDAAKVQCDSVTKGDFFESFVTAHAADGTTAYYTGYNSSNPADNTAGRFPKNVSSNPAIPTRLTVSLAGAPLGPNDIYLGPSGEGDVFVLHMTAKAGASGGVAFELSDIKLGDSTPETNDLHPTVNSGQITIEAVSSAAPTITGINPASGQSGDSVVISGANFVAGATLVKFNDMAAQALVVTDSQHMNATVPNLGSSAIANVIVTVSTPAGSVTGTFAYTGLPATTTTTTTTTTSVPTTATTTNPTTTPTTTTTTSTNPPASTSTSTPPSSTSTSTTTITTTSPVTPSTTVSTTFPTTFPGTPVTTTNSPSRSPVANVMDISQLVNKYGLVQQEHSGILVFGRSGELEIGLRSGSRALESDGRPLTHISVDVPGYLPALPSSSQLIESFVFSPSGATFSDPLQITYRIRPELLKNGERIEDIYLAFFDQGISRWVKSEFTIDTLNSSLVGYISHFSVYAVFIANSGLASTIGYNFGEASIIMTVAAVSLLLVLLAIYLITSRRRSLVREVGGRHNRVLSPPTASYRNAGGASPTNYGNAPGVQIADGKVIIPQNGGKIVISFVNDMSSGQDSGSGHNLYSQKPPLADISESINIHEL